MGTSVTSADSALGDSSNVSRQSSKTRINCHEKDTPGCELLGHPAYECDAHACNAASQSLQLMSTWFTSRLSANPSHIENKPPRSTLRRGRAWEITADTVGGAQVGGETESEMRTLSTRMHA